MQFLSLESLAATLNLPQGFLRELAEKGKIPSLKVGKRIRFDEANVREALSRISQQALIIREPDKTPKKRLLL